MTEPLATLITRTVTITEVMDQDGTQRLVYDPEAMTMWDVLGMLRATVIHLEARIAQLWADADDEAADD